MAEVYLGVGIDASGAKQGANEFGNATDKVSDGANKAAKANDALAKQIKEAQKVIQLQQKHLDSIGGALDQYKMALGQARLAVSQKQKQIDSIKQSMMQYETALKNAEQAVRQQAQEIEHLKSKLAESNTKVDESTKKWKEYEGQIKTSLLVVKAFAAATAALAVREIGNYTQELSNARAMTGATSEQMAELEVVIRELGASTVFSAGEVAKASAELGKAGFKTEEIMTALPATLNLASAATIGVAEASKITANVMAGFGLSAKDVGKAADILGAIAVNSTTDVQGLGEAMRYAGPPAKMLGISLETTAAAMAVMAQNGLEGGQSGRNFASMLFALLKPSREAKKAIADLGLDLQSVNPAFNKLEDVIKRFSDANIDATQSAIIFGAEGFRAFSALSGSPELFEKMAVVVDNAGGSLDRISTIKLDNLWGDFEKLTGELSETALSVGSAGLEGALRGYLQTATDWIESLNGTLNAIIKNKDELALLKDLIGVTTYAVSALIAMKLATWLYGAATAAYAAATAITLMHGAMVLVAAVSAGFIAYLGNIALETSRAEAETRKQEEALLDLPGAYGNAARAGKVAMLELQLATMKTTSELRNEMNKIAQEAERRSGMQNKRFPAGAPAGFSDYGTASQIAGEADTALFSRANAELQKRTAIEKQIADLKSTQYHWETMSSKEAREKLQAAKDFNNELIKGMFYPVGTSVTAKPAASTVPGKVVGGTSTGSFGKGAEASKNFFGAMDGSTSTSAAFEDNSKAFFGTKDTVTSVADDINKYSDANQKLLDVLLATNETEKARGDAIKMYGADLDKINLAMEIQSTLKKLDGSQTKDQTDAIKEQIIANHQLKRADDEVLKKKQELAKENKEWIDSMTDAFKDAIMNSKNLADALGNLANRVQNMLVNKALDSLLGGMFSSIGFAKGAAFSAGGVTAFASGGVVSSPSLFPMSGGRTGLMGEAGPEAIMPLTRTSSGDLGVKAVGAGNSMVIAPVINITVQGGSEEQNQDSANRVGAAVKKAIDDTVMTVILRERRPGGVLT